MTKDAIKKRGVQSVEVGFALLDVLRRSPQPLPLGQLSERAGMARSKAHGYLVSFQRLGLVTQSESSGAYELGPTALELGIAALQRLDGIRYAQDALTRLRDETGHSTFLSIWAASGPTVIYRAEGGKLRLEVRIGFSVPLSTSATGKIFLSHLPRTVTRSFLAEEGVTDAEEQRLVDNVRRFGVAHQIGVTVAGLSSIAAPVFDHQGDILCVLTIVGECDDLDVTLDGSIAGLLRDEAALVSRQLGYEPS